MVIQVDGVDEGVYASGNLPGGVPLPFAGAPCVEVGDDVNGSLRVCNDHDVVSFGYVSECCFDGVQLSKGGHGLDG